MKISKNFIYFLFFGVLTVSIDYFVYTFFYHNFFGNSISKSIGFLMGTLFSFYSNKKYNYKIKGNTYRYLINFLLLYSMTLFFNVFINKILILILSNNLYRIQLSFLIATVISATMNFLGMNFLVFKINEKNK